jgi:nucleotide-binding universal stress UspA family protein
MKTILLHVDQGLGMEARFQAAMDLGRALGARVDCVQAAPVDAYLVGDLVGGLYPAVGLVDVVREAVEKQRADLQARLAEEGVDWIWTRDDNPPTQAIIANSRLADLIVMSLPSRERLEGGIALSQLSHVAIHARSPVLAVPQESRSLDCFGTAVVAWNGSMESAHALRLSLPLLARAGAVHLVEIADDERTLPATDGAEYLSRHGIRCELHEWARDGRLVSAVLLDAAETLGASYLVAGAYGHTRFREAVLGGVSRELLRNSPIPLVLAH